MQHEKGAVGFEESRLLNSCTEFTEIFYQLFLQEEPTVSMCWPENTSGIPRDALFPLSRRNCGNGLKLSQSLKRQTCSSYFMTPEYASTSVTMKSFFSWLIYPLHSHPQVIDGVTIKEILCQSDFPLHTSDSEHNSSVSLQQESCIRTCLRGPKNPRPLLMTLSHGEASNWGWLHKTPSLSSVIKYHYLMYRDLRLPVRESKQQSFDTNNRFLRHLHSCWAQSWVDLVPTPQSRGGSCTFSPVPCQDETLWKDPEIQIEEEGEKNNTSGDSKWKFFMIFSRKQPN